ncbi:alpha/beta fold hydrolase [uncultured Jatrophihabitans sp.]|uniref:alpha/beta fold hydrolase n=1 Tax=uncultured Jatrophihabitans sp. TaxID=1610747 RepID=UPI0035C9BDB8
MTTLVLVHGLWLGGWSWDGVTARLERPAHAVELPMRTPAGDAKVVRAALDGIDDDVVLVGHSYGGAVVTAIGGHPRVRHVVHLAAFLLDEGESISRVAPGHAVPATGLSDALRFSDDRSEVSIDGELAPAILCQHADATTADEVRRRLRPVARALFSDRPSAFSWRHAPSTYVVCTHDRTVAPDLQRVMAARATRTVEWDSDHSPLLSRPGDVAELLDQV